MATITEIGRNEPRRVVSVDDMEGVRVPEGNALATQVGGDHYRSMAIQPAEYIIKNNIGWAEGCAIAYISRWRQKNGVEDLEKAIHTLRLLIDQERGEKA